MLINYVFTLLINYFIEIGVVKKMEQNKLDRINELARAAKVRELTEEEKEEQARLRKEYVALVHNNLRGHLENIRIVEPDGKIHAIKEK